LLEQFPTMNRTLFALAFASLGSDASTKAPSKAEPDAPVRVQRSGEADQQDEHPGRLQQPETPIIYSSRFGFLSSSRELRPPPATRFALFAIVLRVSSTAPGGAAG